MRHLMTAAAVVACAWASPALADSAPASREVQSAVDAYLASAKADTSLVGGAGQAGYDGGFWIRGGSFLMKINLTLQTRWEGFDWSESGNEAAPGGDLSGFSLPRATLKFSGDATCDIHYYAELEFGHSGTFGDNSVLGNSDSFSLVFDDWNGFGVVNENRRERIDYGIAREAWIEWEACPQAAFRMGLIETATTRQLMTPPEMQQFVDISLASAFIGQTMPGYSDRNRDYGFMVHGALGCDGQFQYLLTVTNGDGPVTRNVLDGTTSDNFAFSARVNWDIKGHIGYEEGALKGHECDWALAVGAWAHYYADALQHNNYAKYSDRLTWGVDAGFVWGGLSATLAYSALSWDDENSAITPFLEEGYAYLAQVGYLFPGTAWEIAARYSGFQYNHYFSTEDNVASEYGFAVTYYIDGHADKVTLDVAFIQGDDAGNSIGDVYAGYNPTGIDDGTLIRLQWQLAL